MTLWVWENCEIIPHETPIVEFGVEILPVPLFGGRSPGSVLSCPSLRKSRLEVRASALFAQEHFSHLCVGSFFISALLSLGGLGSGVSQTWFHLVPPSIRLMALSELANLF